MADLRFSEEEDPSILKDVLGAPFRGAEGALQATYNLADFVTGDQILPDYDERLLGRSETTAGALTEGVSQFLTGFIPILGLTSKAGKLAQAGKILGTPTRRAFVAGAVTDFIAFDEQEDRLSNLIQQVPELQNPITDFLAADEDDGVVLGRLKNAIEGAALGFAADGLIQGIKALKKGRKAKVETEDPQATVDAVGDEIGDEVPEITPPPREVDEVVDTEPTPEIPVEDPTGIKPDVDDPTVTKPAEGEPDDFEASLDDFTDEAAAVSDEAFNDDMKAVMQEIRDNPDLDDIPFGEAIKVPRHKTRKGMYDYIRAVTYAIKRKGQNLSGQSDALVEQQTREVLEVLPPSVKQRMFGSKTLSDDIVIQGDIAQRVMSYKLILEAKVKDVISTADAYKKSGSVNDLAEVQSHLEEMFEYQSLYSALGAETSKALRGRKRFSNKTFDDQLIDLIRSNGTAVSEPYMRNKQQKWVKEAVEIVKAGGNPKEMMKKLGVIAEGTGGGRFDMVREYWINNILSGLPTQMANGIGNGLTYMMLSGEQIIGHLATGRLDLAKIAWEAALDIDMFMESFRWAKLAAKEDRALLIPGHTALTEGEVQHAITPDNINELLPSGAQLKEDSTARKLAEFAGHAIRLPGRGLTTADEFFKHINARREAKYQLGLKAMTDAKLTDPQAIADYVTQGMDKLVMETGEIYNEVGVMRKALQEAKNQGITQPDHHANFVKKYMKKNYDKDLGKIAQVARDTAELGTHTRELGGAGRKLQEFQRELPALTFIMPFVRTPINILKFSLRRSLAFGDIRNIPNILDAEKRLKIEMFSNDPTIKAKAMGRVATTAAATANLLGAMHLYHDRISGGGPVDPKQKKALEDQGWQPYSIKIGDTWVSYQRLDPLATIIGVMADIKDAIMESNYGFNDDSTQRLLTTAIVTLQRNVTNKSYLSGVEMFTDAMSDSSGNQAKRMVGNISAGFIPFAGFMKHGQSIVGNQEAKEVRTITDRMLRTLPGAAGTLDPKRNLLGEKKIVQGVPVLQAISPIGYSTAKEDVVFDELAALNHSFRQVDPVYQGVLDLLQYRNEKGQSAHDRRLELIGQVQIGGRTLRQALQKLVTSKRYQKMDPRSEPGLTSPRVTEVNKILYKYRGKALKQTLSEFPELAQYHKEFTRAKRNQRRGQAMDELLQTLNF